MTVRAVILGLLGVVFICGVTYFNDHVIHQTFFVLNHMPISVYGIFIFFVLLLNPVLLKIRQDLALSRKEIIVVLTITLACCGIPGSSLMRHFTNALNLPHYYNNTERGWSDNEVLDMVPDKMLTDPEGDEDTVVVGFVQGLGEGDKHISASEVPWHAWKKPMKFWIPLLLCLWMGLLGLALVVHKQWSEHENLPYPIARFADSLLPDENKEKNPIFSNRLFWIGACAVFVIHLNNYLHSWWPDTMIPIPIRFNLSPLAAISETFSRGWGGWLLSELKLYFSAVGIAYFLASDVSFSIAVGPFLWMFSQGIFAKYGVPLHSALEGRGTEPRAFITWGAYTGVFLSMIYMGRNWYLAVFRKVFAIPNSRPVDKYAVYGGRLFVIGFVLFIILMSLGGLDWQLSIVFGVSMIIVFLVMSRIMAETGLFFIIPVIYSSGLLVGLFGTRALGPDTIAVMGMFTLVMIRDSRETMMPFVVNALQNLKLQNIEIGRTARWYAVAIVLGLAVAVPVTLYLQYDNGTDKTDPSSMNSPKDPFKDGLQAKQKLEGLGLLEESREVSGWGRFAEMSPNSTGLYFILGGLVLVVVCNMLRFRFSRWPIHPVLFLTWHSWPAMWFCFSFFVGWAIKTVVLKYAGQKVYQQLKPMMVGLIAGEVVAAFVPMIVGSIYYFVTGNPPARFIIIPS